MAAFLLVTSPVATGACGSEHGWSSVNSKREAVGSLDPRGKERVSLPAVEALTLDLEAKV
jgi:hypothetical protein